MTQAPWPGGTGAVSSSGAGPGFRRLFRRHRLGHRLHVEPAVTQVDPHTLAGLDPADVETRAALREFAVQLRALRERYRAGTL